MTEGELSDLIKKIELFLASVQDILSWTLWADGFRTGFLLGLILGLILSYRRS